MVSQEKFPVAFEIGPKRRVFAQALEWIGWCRAGKDEATALDQLLAVGLRYAVVAAQAGFPLRCASLRRGVRGRRADERLRND